MKKWSRKNWQAWAKTFPVKNSGEQTKPDSIIFRNAEDDGEPLEILIYGEIGSSWWDDSGVSAKDFANDLAAIPKDREILVCINSPGGNVWDGWAIHNLLAARRDMVTCRVDGVAASIASVIALAGREVRMPKASMLMIHNASGMCIGTADDMKEMADALQKHTDVIAGVYQDKTGKSIEDIKSLMDAETWLTSEEALSDGFCDIVESPSKKPTAKISASLVVGEVRNQTPKTPAGKSEGGANKSIMNREQTIALLNKWGIKFDEKATDEQLVALLVNYEPPKPQEQPKADAKQAERLERIEAELKKRKDADVTRRVQACVDSGRLPAGQFKAALARALADESYVNELEALEPRVIGAEPVVFNAKDGPKAVKHAEFIAMDHGSRNKFIRAGGKITA